MEAGLPRLTAHGLRHTSATLMLDAGVAPKVAAARLGHADPVLFLCLYSHVTPTMSRDEARAIGDSLFRTESAAASNPYDAYRPSGARPSDRDGGCRSSWSKRSRSLALRSSRSTRSMSA